MNQKPDEAENAGTDRPDEHSEDVAPVAIEEPVETPLESSATDAPPEVKPRARAGLAGAIAGLALLLALAALAGTGYLAWQGRDVGSGQADTQASISALAGNVDEAVQSLGTLRNRLTALTESDAAYGSELASLERQLDQLLERYESIPARLTSLETTMSSLQGISTGARDNWWLAEAEYYMQIANAQLQLAGNPRLARLALQFADERIRQLGNPALVSVRRALAGELRALQAMERPDIEGVTMQLASLAETVGTLPVEEDARLGRERKPPVDDEAGPLDRAMASLKRAFGDVVSVRRTDEEIRPLMSPDARYFLEANLALQMQTARLALLRGEQTVFEQCLADAESWLRQYYDTDSASVTSALASIDDIRESFVTVNPPDISRSLALLRQYRARTVAEAPGDGGGQPGGTTENGQQ